MERSFDQQASKVNLGKLKIILYENFLELPPVNLEEFLVIQNDKASALCYIKLIN